MFAHPVAFSALHSRSFAPVSGRRKTLLIRVLAALLLGSVAAHAQPRILITEPHEGQFFDADATSVEIVGRVESTTAVTSLSIDGAAVSIEPDGSFLYTLALTPGENRTLLSATDASPATTDLFLTLRRWSPVHGLEVLADRAGRVPELDAVVGPGGEYDSERVDFIDSRTGTRTARLTDGPEVERHYYQGAPVWNADGSRLLFESTRAPLGTGQPAYDRVYYWTLDADGRGLEPIRQQQQYETNASLWGREQQPRWSKADPNLLYYTAANNTRDPNTPLSEDLLWEYDLSQPTNAARHRVLWSKDRTGLAAGERITGFVVSDVHPDGQQFLVLRNITDALGDEISTGHLIAVPPPGGTANASAGLLFPYPEGIDGKVHQIWFTKQSDHSLLYNLQTLTGTTKSLGLLADPLGASAGTSLCHLDLGNPASHRAHSPSGAQMAASFSHNDHATGLPSTDKWSRGISIRDVDCAMPLANSFADLHWGRPGLIVTGEAPGELVTIEYHGGHRSWMVDEDWLIDNNGDLLFRIWTERYRQATLVAHPNTTLDQRTYSSHPFPVSSPDGTKVAYNSSMLGSIDLYQTVMKLPDAPPTLTANLAAGDTTLVFDAPPHAKEIAGYFAYFASESGGTSAVAPGPITPTVLPGGALEIVLPGYGPGFWQVTAVEHSGLEGAPSREASSHSATQPRRVVVEAEAGEFVIAGDLALPARPVMASFDASAGGLYSAHFAKTREEDWTDLDGPGPEETTWIGAHSDVVDRDRSPLGLGGGPTGTPGEVRVPVTIPEPGSYAIWARISERSALPGAPSQSLDLEVLDSGMANLASATLAVESRGWEWAQAHNGAVPLVLALTAGDHELVFRTLAFDVYLDQVLLTSVAGDVPAPAAFIPGAGGTLAAPSSLSATATAPTRCALSWPAVTDATRYDVFAGPVADANRVASTTDLGFEDRRLVPGAAVDYNVVAVGAGGAASTPASATCTPSALASIVELEAPGTTTVVDIGGVDREINAFEFDVPIAGDYVVWARFRAAAQIFESNDLLRVCLSSLQSCDDAQATSWSRSLIPWRYVSTLGPTAVEQHLWVAARLSFDEGQPFALPTLPAGPLTLKFHVNANTNGHFVDVGDVVLTNDRSAVPWSGLSSFLLDEDDDSVQDRADRCPGFSDPLQHDYDGDGTGDVCDNCLYAPNGESDAIDQLDGDGDGYGNVCDADFDNDGMYGTSDSDMFWFDFCIDNPDFDGSGLLPPYDFAQSIVCPPASNPPAAKTGAATDIDGDGQVTLEDGLWVVNIEATSQATGPSGLAGDRDSDQDGWLDAFDNCPLDFNPGQEDSDGNGVGNACDATPVPTMNAAAAAICGILLLLAAGVATRRERRPTPSGAGNR